MTLIQRQRERLGISRQELADRLGVNPRQIDYWSSGRRPVPNRHVLQLAQILDLPPELLAYGVGPQPYAYWPTEKAYALYDRETV